MKKFNLEAALAGAPVVTRTGKVVNSLRKNPALQFVADGYGYSVYDNGKYVNGTNGHDMDLFMADVKPEIDFEAVPHGFFVIMGRGDASEVFRRVKRPGIGGDKGYHRTGTLDEIVSFDEMGKLASAFGHEYIAVFNTDSRSVILSAPMPIKLPQPVPIKKVGWIGIMRNGTTTNRVFKTREEAEEATFVLIKSALVKVEWEE